jgi:endonuclease IV
MKIHKYCVPNIEDRCTSCRRRHVSKTKKRVCPLYSALQKKDPVELYEYFATETTELRKKIDELEDTIQFIIRHPRTRPN